MKNNNAIFTNLMYFIMSLFSFHYWHHEQNILNTYNLLPGARTHFTSVMISITTARKCNPSNLISYFRWPGEVSFLLQANVSLLYIWHSPAKKL